MKKYRTFEENIEEFTDEDGLLVEDIFLDIADEFDLYKREKSDSGNPPRTYREFHLINAIPENTYDIIIVKNVIRITFKKLIKTEKEGDQIFTKLKHFHEVVKSNFPGAWINYTINRESIRPFDIFRNGPDKDHILHCIMVNKTNWGFASLFEINIIA